MALAERHSARVFVAPMSARCGFPEDHRLFAGFLPAMRERIVARLAGHDLVFALGAPAFTYHVEGSGPHVPDGATLLPVDRRPRHRGLDAARHRGVASIRLAPCRPAGSGRRRRASAAAAARADRAGARRAPAGERMSVAFALQTLADAARARPASSSRKRRARAR